MLPNWYFDIFNRYKETLQQKDALYVALSAGVDSNTLLHWLYTFKDELPPIATIHVNHNWHGDYSHLWANFAKKRAAHYGFEHYHYEAHFADHDPRGLEAAGREMRYLKFGETMKENSLLCVGHHRSDQAETLMQRLLRSSGVRGLGAMRDFNRVEFGPYEIELFRPFLSISKQTLYETATHLELPWLEDYTNHEAEDMERNIIRNNIFKIMEQEFPKYEAAFYQVTQFMQEADDLLTELAHEDLLKVGRTNPFATTKETPLTLHLPTLRTFSPTRQKNLLQNWVRPYNLIFSQKQMLEFMRVFVQETPTHQAVFKMEEYGIFFFQDHLYLRELAEGTLSKKALPEQARSEQAMSKQAMSEQTLSEKKWSMSFQLIAGDNAPSADFWAQFKDEDLILVKREGGERFHPVHRDKSQMLRKLLQEANLPLWERDQCWLLKKRETDEVLWINHLGFAKSLSQELRPQGLTPTLIKIPIEPA